MAHSPTASPRKSRIAVVAARWHAEIVDQAVRACREDLLSDGYTVAVSYVPGAFEIPLRVKQLASTGEYAAIAACGFVVNGGIYRHDFVAATVVDALMQVQLETGIPAFSAVLTPLHFHDHDEHHGFFRDHFAVKGRELARAIVQTLTVSAA